MVQADATDALFDMARTHRFFTDQPVGEDLLLRLYDLVKFAPTESNFCPMRLTFVTSKDGFDRVIEAAAPETKTKFGRRPLWSLSLMTWTLISILHNWRPIWTPRPSQRTQRMS